jgi:hypothetical protein
MAEMKWRPIETIPDEGNFLVYRHGIMHVVDAENRISYGLEAPGFFNGDVYVCPSHWMPLPPPPEAED